MMRLCKHALCLCYHHMRDERAHIAWPAGASALLRDIMIIFSARDIFQSSLRCHDISLYAAR